MSHENKKVLTPAFSKQSSLQSNKDSLSTNSRSELRRPGPDAFAATQSAPAPSITMFLRPADNNKQPLSSAHLPQKAVGTIDTLVPDQQKQQDTKVANWANRQTSNGDKLMLARMLNQSPQELRGYTSAGMGENNGGSKTQPRTPAPSTYK
jgi:hypothetical protein